MGTVVLVPLPLGTIVPSVSVISASGSGPVRPHPENKTQFRVVRETTSFPGPLFSAFFKAEKRDPGNEVVKETQANSY